MEELYGLIEERLGWKQEDVTVLRQGDGLTGDSYIVSRGRDRWVIRTGNSDSRILGISRRAEKEALQRAEAAGIGAKVLHFDESSGAMITAFIEGTKWTAEDVKSPPVMKRIARRFREIHALPAVEHRFSPYRDIRERLEFAASRGAELPRELPLYRRKLAGIEEERRQSAQIAFCHNDPFPNNFIDDGTVRLIDWEYAGMGDIFFDLACLCMFYGAEEKKKFLRLYFGALDDSRLDELEAMTFVARFWNAAWALVQSVRGRADFDYPALAKNIFNKMGDVVTSRARAVP